MRICASLLYCCFLSYAVFMKERLLRQPAPTVLPPSLIANLCSFSIAIGVISSIVTSMLSPGITISTPLSQIHYACYVSRCEIKLRSVSVKKRCMSSALFFLSIRYTVALNFVCGLIDPGFASTCPRSISVLSTPRRSAPMLSPASP